MSQENKEDDEKTMIEDVQEKFSEKFDNCPKCRIINGREMICRRHRAMVAKYLRKKHDAKLTDMAKMMKDMAFGDDKEN